MMLFWLLPDCAVFGMQERIGPELAILATAIGEFLLWMTVILFIAHTNA